VRGGTHVFAERPHKHTKFKLNSRNAACSNGLFRSYSLVPIFGGTGLINQININNPNPISPCSRVARLKGEALLCALKGGFLAGCFFPPLELILFVNNVRRYHVHMRLDAHDAPAAAMPKVD